MRGLPPAVVGGSLADAVAVWRAAFLPRGSLTEPGRSTSMEITCPGSEAALALVGAARRLGIAVKSRDVRGVERVVSADDGAAVRLRCRVARVRAPRLEDDHRLGDGWDWAPGSLPVTEDIGRRTLALPFHSNLGEAEVERVADALANALSDWPRPK